MVWQIRAWLTAVSGHLWMAFAHNSKELKYPWPPPFQLLQLTKMQTLRSFSISDHMLSHEHHHYLSHKILSVVTSRTATACSNGNDIPGWCDSDTKADCFQKALLALGWWKPGP
jgi:hypothetical protein